MKILIINVKILGLPCFQVYVNGVFQQQHLSKELAMSKAKAMLQRIALQGHEGVLYMDEERIIVRAA